MDPWMGHLVTAGVGCSHDHHYRLLVEVLNRMDFRVREWLRVTWLKLG